MPLELSELARYRFILDQVPHIVWTADQDGALTYCNPYGLAFLGAKEEQIMDYAWHEFIYSDDMPMVKQKWQEAVSQGTEYNNEQRIRKAKDGRYYWFKVIAKPMLRADGSIEQWVGISTLIHSYKNKVNELVTTRDEAQAMATRLSVATDAAGLGIWEWDLPNNRILWDDRMYDIYDVVPNGDDPAYETWYNVIHPEDARRAERSLLKAVEEQTIFDTAFRIVHRNGAIRHIKAYAKPILDDEGKTRQMIGLNWDVTESVMAEQKARELERQLLQGQKLETIGTLASGIAHDFNNILGGILGAAEIALRQAREDSPARPYLQTIIGAVDRAHGLTKQILTFSREEETFFEEVDPAQITREAVKLIRATLPSSIDIDHEIGEGLGSIHVDATKLHQILINLCTNSAHAMPDRHGKIELRVQAIEACDCSEMAEIKPLPDKLIRFKVQDNGVGMDEKTMQRIYDPFFTTKSKSEGTGLGLSVVHGIVKKYHGVINVESAPGQGTTFTICFPRYEPGQAEPIAKVVRQPFRPLSGKVLLVDDEPMLREGLATYMESLGCSYTTCSKGGDAWTLLASGQEDYSLIITDHTLPGLTGLEIAQKYRAMGKNTPIILATGLAIGIEQDALAALGNIILLKKPYSLDELDDAIAELTSQ